MLVKSHEFYFNTISESINFAFKATKGTAIMKNLQDTFLLSNGTTIPCLGFGTWQIKEQAATTAVLNAIECGYRHIDTAAVYENESEVGDAIRTAGIPRNQLFITSKLWNNNKTVKQARQAFEETMKRLQLDYLDLYLIHWPAVPNMDPDWLQTNREKWRALENLHAEGRIRAIGVSNFLPHHFEPLLADVNITPMVNQIEVHPGFPQHAAVAYCHKHKIQPQAWSPLGKGEVLNAPEIKTIAKKHGKTPAQVCLRWCLQNNVLPLTKTVSPERMKSNADIFDFTLAPEEISILDSLPPCGGGCINPDTRTF